MNTLDKELEEEVDILETKKDDGLLDDNESRATNYQSSTKNNAAEKELLSETMIKAARNTKIRYLRISDLIESALSLLEKNVITEEKEHFLRKFILVMLDLVEPSDIASVFLENDLYELFISIEYELAKTGQEDKRVVLVTNVFR